MDAKLCQSWQGFLQLIVLLVSNGYWHYCLTHLPEKKRDKWTTVDEKLCRRYPPLSKWQRARKKKNGYANFYYFRWEAMAMIMHTDGVTNGPLEDIFLDVRRNPIPIVISSLTTFLVSPEQNGDKKHISVRLDRATYKGIKETLYEIAKTKDKRKIWIEFNKLNGFPAYRDIIRQKQQLATYASKQAKRNQLQIEPNFFRIYTRLKRYKIFDE